MRYLLDSNLIIPYLEDDPATVAFVERLTSGGIAISIVTYMEAYQGTVRSADPELAQTLFERALAEIPILPFSPAVARRCARLREDLKGRGRRVRDRALGLMIAATAIEHGLQLVTRNWRDFADIPNLVLYQLSRQFSLTNHYFQDSLGFLPARRSKPASPPHVILRPVVPHQPLQLHGQQ